ncbi:hypothetical protein K5549_020584, partial [Capra hircus]
VLVPKKNQIAIYELLFEEVVMVTKMDIHMPKHPELADKNTPNLHVMKAMQSFFFNINLFNWRLITSQNCHVKEQFGIQCLCNYLQLPPEIVPATLHHSHPETGWPRPKGLEGEHPARLTQGEVDRDKPKAGAGSATEFQFRGHGQPPQ